MCTRTDADPLLEGTIGNHDEQSTTGEKIGGVSEARGQGPSVVEALRSVFDPEVWRLAIGTA